MDLMFRQLSPPACRAELGASGAISGVTNGASNGATNGASNGASVHDPPIARISVETLKQKLDAEESPLLLDVRAAHELTQDGYLPGVINIPIDSLSHRLDELKPIQNQEIVAICRSDRRAYRAAQMLTEAGFERVSVLTGGMTAWKAAGYPLAATV